MINQTVVLSTSGLSGAIVETGAVEHLIDESFADSTLNQLVTLSFAYASVKQVYLVASTNTYWYTNGASGAGGQTFLLKAGIPFFWSATSAYLANPLSIDVTAFYFSCTVASHVQGFILTA
ncbi:MAG: hypothetical protein ACLP7Q_18285 [Isosphaeraceae bacterium]